MNRFVRKFYNDGAFGVIFVIKHRVKSCLGIKYVRYVVENIIPCTELLLIIQKDGYFLANLALKSINLIISITNMVVPGKNDSL